MIFKSDKLDYLRGPGKEFFFDNFFSIGQGPSNVRKLNWNLLGFFSFIFSIGQCAHLLCTGLGNYYRRCRLRKTNSFEKCLQEPFLVFAQLLTHSQNLEALLYIPRPKGQIYKTIFLHSFRADSEFFGMTFGKITFFFDFMNSKDCLKGHPNCFT